MNENYIEEMENEEEALNQSLALNKVIINLLKQQRETNKRMFIALIVSILVNLLTCIAIGKNRILKYVGNLLVCKVPKF